MPSDSSHKLPESSGQGSPAGAVSISEFAALLMRRAIIWVPVFLAVLIISVGGYYTSESFYRSVTKVQVSRGERESTLNARVRVRSWEEEIASEIEALGSDPVLRRAEELLLENEVYTAAGDTLTISGANVGGQPVSSSSVIEITFQHRERGVVRAGAKAVTQAYMEFRRSTGSAPEVDAFFVRRIAEVEADLDAAIEERRLLLAEAGMASLGEERIDAVGLKSSLRSQLVDVREQIEAERARIEAVRYYRQTGGDIDFVTLINAEGGGRDASLRRLIDALVQIQTRENELSARFTDEHPQVLEVRSQLEGQRALVAEAILSYEHALATQLNQFEARELFLMGELDRIEQYLQEFPDFEAALRRVDVRIETLEDRYRQLSDGQSSADIQNASAPNWSVRLFSDASSPSLVRTGNLIRTLVVPAFALVVALGLAFIIDGLDPSVKTEREAERILGARVLASVGRVGRK